MRGWGEVLGLLGSRYFRLRRAYYKKYPKAEFSRGVGIEKAQIKATLAEYPNVLAECDLTPAKELFGEEFVSSLEISGTAYRAAIKNLDTGQVFESISAAGRHHFLSGSTIRRAIKRGGMSGGFRWERIN